MIKNSRNFKIRFECQSACADCCKLSGGHVFLNEDEAQAISVFLQISEDEFLRRFTRIWNDRLCLVDNPDDHCIFLKSNRCSIYSVRPWQCRVYPFWEENLKSVERWKIISKECPGIGCGDLFSKEKIIEMSEQYDF